MRNRNQILALSLVLAFAAPTLVACGGSQAAEPEASGQAEQQTGVANPFVDCTSASEVAQLAGFDVTFPESVPGYPERHYQAIEEQMAQCLYFFEDDKGALVRKAVDDGSGDISGDYGEYDEVSTTKIEGADVTQKGTGGLVYCAIWSRDGYLFAIDATYGLEPDVMEGLVAETF